MSQPSYRWKRRAALLVAGLAAGAPLLAPGPAGAADATLLEGGRQVTFSGGGLLAVSCAAEPSTGSVSVAAESTLRVVNRTGHRATLLLDGSARGEVAQGGAAEVLFHRGPVRLALKPHCVLADQKSVRVQVVTPRPPADEPPAAGPTQPGGTGGRPSGGTGTSGGTGSTGQAGAGRTPNQNDLGGNRRRAVPGDRAPEPAPTADGPAASDGRAADDWTSVDESPPQAGTWSGQGSDLAAEPLSSVEPMSDGGPIGLLALIAIVCVLGASVGAIRAILSQRASRAGLAVN